MTNLKDILLEMILKEACWDRYEQQGMKKKGNRMVPNCVRVSEEKKKKDKVNPAYLTKDAAAMKREIDRVKKLKSDDPSAYGKWDADYSDKGKTKKYKTKKSAATSAYEKRFGKPKKEAALPDPETTLISKDPQTGRTGWSVDYKVTAKELYKRLDDIIKFLDHDKKDPDFNSIKSILIKLKSKTSKLKNDK